MLRQCGAARYGNYGPPPSRRARHCGRPCSTARRPYPANMEAMVADAVELKRAPSGSPPANVLQAEP